MINFPHAQLAQKLILACVLVTGIVIGAALVYFLAVPDLGETTTSVETSVSTEIDTIHVDTLVRNSITPEFLMSSVKSDSFESRFDSIRTYTGTNQIQNGTITWSARTGGILKDLDIATDIQIPVITNTVVQKETVTREVFRPSIYATGTLESDRSFSPGATYVRRNMMIGYRYNLTGVNPASRHGLTVGIRIK